MTICATVTIYICDDVMELQQPVIMELFVTFQLRRGFQKRSGSHVMKILKKKFVYIKGLK